MTIKTFKKFCMKGEVVVTADHSLISEDGFQIKPTELRNGDKVMWKEIN